MYKTVSKMLLIRFDVLMNQRFTVGPTPYRSDYDYFREPMIRTKIDIALQDIYMKEVWVRVIDYVQITPGKRSGLAHPTNNILLSEMLLVTRYK